MEDTQDWEQGFDPLGDYLEADGFFNSDEAVAYATEQQPLATEGTVSDDSTTWETFPLLPDYIMQVRTAFSFVLCASIG